jgi:hypothetical protein
VTRLQRNWVTGVRRPDTRARFLAWSRGFNCATGGLIGQTCSYAARVPSRTGVLAWLGGAALVTGAVIVLRATDDQPVSAPGIDAVAPPVRISQYAAGNVVLPQPGERPRRPAGLVAVPSTGRLRLSWSEPGGAVGYDVRWSRAGEPPRTRLVIAPDTELDGLRDGEPYRVEVRGVDAFGRRSDAAAVVGTPGKADESWRSVLTGLFDDFSDRHSVLADVSGSHWHVSGYRGCVDLGLPGSVDGKGLPIDLGCGADLAVLRARQPMVLGVPGRDGVLGRFSVVTDTAGSGGELTADLVPGPADRVGAGRADTGGGPDPTLPAGTIRVVVNDSGAVVRGGVGVPATTPVATPVAAQRRGPGVLHRFDVLLTVNGVQVLQDGTLVAVGGLVPPWQQAWLLLGFRGPDGHRARVHLAAAGFSGPPAAPDPVVEAAVYPATRQVLTLTDTAPGVGFARTPLVGAEAARLVMTITTAPGLDVGAATVQLGDHRVPAHPVVTAPSAPGSALTLVADLPPELLGGPATGSLTPFVLRAPGAGDGVGIMESYLEITPGPDWAPGEQPDRAPNTDPRRPAADALPAISAVLTNTSGAPLQSVPQEGQLVLTIDLSAATAQWDSGGVAGVQGIELWLDGRIIAGIPTASEGAGVGGRYVISIAPRQVPLGPHVFDIREYGATQPTSLLRNFAVESAT